MQEIAASDTIITIADNTLNPQEWQDWLETYAAIRTREFIRLLETKRRDMLV